MNKSLFKLYNVYKIKEIMSWKYRIIKHKNKENPFEDDYAIHEVYYDENNKPYMYTKNPITITANSTQGIKWIVDKIKIGIKKPTLNEKIFNKK